jgi:hypothetical protein
MQHRLRWSDCPSRTWYRGVTHSEADGRLAGVEVTGRLCCGFRTALYQSQSHRANETATAAFAASHAGNGRGKHNRVLERRQDGDCKISASAGQRGTLKVVI